VQWALPVPQLPMTISWLGRAPGGGLQRLPCYEYSSNLTQAAGAAAASGSTDQPLNFNLNARAVY
jgi:hypothetical protein